MMRVLALLSEEALARRAYGCSRSQALWPEIRSQGVELKILPVERVPRRPREQKDFARDKAMNALEAVLNEWEPEIIHAEGLGAAPYLPRLTGRPSQAKQTLTFFQLESEVREEAMARFFGPAFQFFSPLAEQIYLQRIRAWERQVASELDLCFALTPQDRLRYQKICPDGHWSNTHAGVRGRGGRRAPQVHSRSILLVASMENPQERQGLRWFCEQVLPRLGEGTLLTIASDGSPRGLQRFLARHRCQIVPSHRDLEHLYYSHALCVVPVLSGRGFEHRILEPLSFERAVVTTPMALAGLELAEGQGVMVADSPENFARCASRLLDNLHERQAIAGMGCNRANNLYDWKAVARSLIERWQGLLGIRSAVPRSQERLWQSAQR